MKTRFIFFLLCLFAHFSWAGNLPTYYPKPGLTYFSADGTRELGLWKGTGPIQDAIILDSRGMPFDPVSGMKPLGANEKKVFIGTKLNGQYVALPADQLTTISKSGAVAGNVERMPPPGACAEPCECGEKINRDSTVDLKRIAESVDVGDVTCQKPKSDQDKDVASLLLDFHNYYCEKGRKGKSATSTAEDMKALKKEWEDFIAEQPSSLRAKAERARAIDYTARTAAFEAESIKDRDNIDAIETCINPLNCPRSACELRIISQTVKNRGHLFNKRDKNKTMFESITDAARDEDYYDIWKPTHTTPYITTCLLRQGILSSRDDKRHRQSAIKFRMAVQAAALVLSKDAQEIFDAEGEGVDRPVDAINGITRYYHPPAMEGCDRHFSNYNRTDGSSYIYKMKEGKVSDVHVLVKDWLVPGEPSPDGKMVSLRIRRKRSPRDYSKENPSHFWTPADSMSETEKSDWFIRKDEIHPVVTGNTCNVHGMKTFSGKSKKACLSRPGYEPLKGSFMRKIPKWVYNAPPKNLPEIVCKGLPDLNGSGRMASYGGPCDNEMQIVSDGGL